MMDHNIIKSDVAPCMIISHSQLIAVGQEKEQSIERTPNMDVCLTVLSILLNFETPHEKAKRK